MDFPKPPPGGYPSQTIFDVQPPDLRPPTVAVGDRISVGGGWLPEPEWLAGRYSVEGSVLAWIDEGAEKPSCVVQLDEPITSPWEDGEGRRHELTGAFLVVTLRHAGRSWQDSGTVHVVLCSDDPSRPGADTAPTRAWVEAQAGYRRF